MKGEETIIDKDHGFSEFWGIRHEPWDIQRDGSHGLDIDPTYIDDFTGI